MRWNDFEKPGRWIAALEDDRFVLRSFALGILKDLAEPPPEAVMPALRQVERHGWRGSYQFPSMVASLPHTEESFPWLVKRLRPLAANRGPRVGDEKGHLCRWFCRAPVDWLAREIEAFAPAPTDSTESAIERWAGISAIPRSGDPLFGTAVIRLALARRSDRELEDRAEELVGRCADQDGFPHAEVKELEFLAETMAARGLGLEKAAGEWLDVDEGTPDTPLEAGHFRAGFALMLLREGRARAPLDKLLRLLRFDWDWFNELYQKLLRVTADRNTVSALVETYPTLDWAGRLFTSTVIEWCWEPEHEATLLQLARDEEDPMLQVGLAAALVIGGSVESRAFARELALECPTDPECRRILDLDFVRTVVTEGETPEAQARLAEMGQEMADQERRVNQLTGQRHLIAPAKAAPKVGRNDSCPCGSGKKYKKCCL